MMKSQSAISIVLVLAGVILVPTMSSAQAGGKPSYQSLQVKIKAMQVKIDSLQAQVNKLKASQRFRAIDSMTRGFVLNPPYQQHFYDFPANPIPTYPTPGYVVPDQQAPKPPRLYNIPDSRVILLSQSH